MALLRSGRLQDRETEPENERNEKWKLIQSLVQDLLHISTAHIHLAEFSYSLIIQIISLASKDQFSDYLFSVLKSLWSVDPVEWSSEVIWLLIELYQSQKVYFSLISLYNFPQFDIFKGHAKLKKEGFFQPSNLNKFSRGLHVIILKFNSDYFLKGFVLCITTIAFSVEVSPASFTQF